MKKEKNFDLIESLYEIVNIRNNQIHTSTRYIPVDFINLFEEEIKNNALNNIINSQKKIHNNKNINLLKENTKVLIKNQFLLFDKILLPKKFNKKGKFEIPGNIIKVQNCDIYIVNIKKNIYNLNANGNYKINYKLLKTISEEVFKVFLK